MADISATKPALNHTLPRNKPPDWMKEKREYPRIEKDLPLKLSDPEFDIVTKTKNISGNGAYCDINKPIPLMTKLNIVILVPAVKNKNQFIKKVNCQGVVVRRKYTKDNGRYSYSVGIYFNEIAEKNRKILLSYINSCLPSHH